LEMQIKVMTNLSEILTVAGGGGGGGGSSSWERGDNRYTRDC
jgi:hypothetical protein